MSQVLRKQLEATQDRFRVGEVTRTDVAQAESSLAQAIGTLTSADGTLRQSQADMSASSAMRPAGCCCRGSAQHFPLHVRRPLPLPPRLISM